ncbi:Uncharacterised protein [uncultured archaeon]|nr:Uncharacterised protein [uncultured archaeon]
MITSKQVKVLRKHSGKEITDKFFEILGIGGSNFKLAYPKYGRLRVIVDKFINQITFFKSVKLWSQFPTEKQTLDKYITDFNQLKNQYFHDVPVQDVEHPTETEIKIFTTHFEQTKRSVVSDSIVATCRNLMSYKKHIKSGEPINFNSLFNVAGNKFDTIDKLDINFKSMFITDKLDAQDKEDIGKLLHNLLHTTYEYYEEMMKPDIDPDELVVIVEQSIDEIRHKLPRCDTAFDLISKSIHMLKDNFSNYYKDFVIANNPTVIFENFVMDVSKTTKTSAKVKFQFRQIISYYKKLAQQNAGNMPSLQSVFKKADEHLNILDMDLDEDEAGDDAEKNEDVKEPKDETKEAMPNMTDLVINDILAGFQEDDDPVSQSDEVGKKKKKHKKKQPS